MELEVYVLNYQTIDLYGALRDQTTGVTGGFSKLEHLHHQSANPDRLRRCKSLMNFAGCNFLLKSSLEVISRGFSCGIAVKTCDQFCGERFFSIHRMNRAAVHLRMESLNCIHLPIAEQLIVAPHEDIGDRHYLAKHVVRCIGNARCNCPATCSSYAHRPNLRAKASSKPPALPVRIHAATPAP